MCIRDRFMIGLYLLIKRDENIIKNNYVKKDKNGNIYEKLSHLCTCFSNHSTNFEILSLTLIFVFNRLKYPMQIKSNK